MAVLTMAACSSKPEMTAEEIAAYNWIPSEVDTNPIVERLSAEEIQEDRTPVARAYNFVNAILNYDEEGMKKNFTFGDMWTEQANAQYGNFKAFVDSEFSEGKLGILPWKDLVVTGDYEIVPVFVQDESYYIEEGSEMHGFNQEVRGGKIYLPDEDEYKEPTILCQKVYIKCVPISEIGLKGFQDITRIDDTNVKVIVNYIDGKWRITGFK
ncbi:MAG: hypothetical protein J1E38_09065 [Paramuribaculum sp.]|nr:hypothetical protein [Paramuribaculum sp.]